MSSGAEIVERPDDADGPQCVHLGRGGASTLSTNMLSVRFEFEPRRRDAAEAHDFADALNEIRLAELRRADIDGHGQMPRFRLRLPQGQLRAGSTQSQFRWDNSSLFPRQAG